MEPNKEERPWGFFEILYEDKTCKIKKITIKPLCSISLQYHNNRKETWTIISGEGKATVFESSFNVFQGSVVDIPYKAKHRLKNTTLNEHLVFIEVQTGISFEESDIIRISDEYFR